MTLSPLPANRRKRKFIAPKEEETVAVSQPAG
jgi:hypothetical protein